MVVLISVVLVKLLHDLITPSSFNFDKTYRDKKEGELIPIAIQLLHCDDIALQHEAVEILRVLLLSYSLQVWLNMFASAIPAIWV